jgi:hypothetical protein
MPKKNIGLNDFPGIILCDKQEKKVYTFQDIPADVDEGGGVLNIKTSELHLKTGDYSLYGHERNGITIERKSKDDMWRTIIQARARFERELQRMQAFNRSYVVIECELSELLDPPWWRNKQGELVQCKYPPKSIHRTILAWEMRYPKTHWKMLPGRRASEVITLRLLDRYLTEFAMEYGENK